MTTLRKAMLLILLCAALAGLPLAAQDCSFTFTFTGDASQPGVSNLSGNTPCVNWRVTYSTTGTLTSAVTFQTSPDNSTWTSVPNTVCSAGVQPPCIIQGSNPTASGAQGMIYASLYANYVRVITTGSAGTGTGKVRAYGAKGASAASPTTVLPVAKIIDNSSPITITQSGYHFCAVAVGCTYALPTITSANVDLQVCAANAVGESGVLTFQAPTATTIDLNGTNTVSAGAFASAGAAGDSGCISAVSMGQYKAYIGVGVWNGVSGGGSSTPTYPLVIASAAPATTQANTGQVTLYTTAAAGVYRICIPLSVTVAGTSGSLNAQYIYAGDGHSFQPYIAANVDWTTQWSSNTRYDQPAPCNVFYADSGSAIIYAIAVGSGGGTARYAVSLERLQ